jgi:hypothetical protein
VAHRRGDGRLYNAGRLYGMLLPDDRQVGPWTRQATGPRRPGASEAFTALLSHLPARHFFPKAIEVLTKISKSSSSKETAKTRAVRATRRWAEFRDTGEN